MWDLIWKEAFMSTAAERAKQLALISRLKATFPEVPEWPTPDMITHDQLPGIHEDRTRRRWRAERAGALREQRRRAVGADDLCALRGSGWGGVWVSEERRRIGNVDVGRAIYLACRTTPAGCGRWAGC